MLSLTVKFYFIPILHDKWKYDTMLTSLTFSFIKNSERYAEDNKDHLKAKNKEMWHQLHMQIRCQFKILFGDKFFKQFLNTFTYNA